jgi:nucleoside-diphosphate-sugar epimerase
MMKVFLTGATGYIGTAVTDALKAAGHALTGMARNEESAKKLGIRGLTVVQAELTDKETITTVARTCDAVIHMASTNDANMATSDRATVEAILDALSGSGKPFIYTSGVWVLGQTGAAPADEATPASSPLALVAWRPAHEQLALTAKAMKGMVLRPGIVYGRGGGIPAMWVAAAAAGAVRYVGKGDQQWTTVHVDDLADLYVKALAKPAAGAVWHGISGQVEARKLAEAAAKSGGKNATVGSLPLEEARKTMGPFADALAASQVISAEKTKQALGWKPSRPGILEDVKSGSYVKAEA